MIGKTKLAVNALIILAFSLSFAAASASFQVTSFSCSPSEVVINSQFSCTATVSNVGDASGSVSTATLYPDSNNWLENSNYPQSSGASVSAGQSTSITFAGLKAIKSGSSNGFSKIMLDSVTDIYVIDIDVNVIDVAVTASNSVSSAAMGASFTTSAEVTAGGNIDVVLAFAVDSGGCSIGSQASSVTISGMTGGSKQSRTWTVTQGTGGNCRYTISAAATGTGGEATKTSSVSGSISCTNCPTDSGSTSTGGGSGAGGGGTTVASLGELIGILTKELSAGEKIEFNISAQEHSLAVLNLTETYAVIKVQSEAQTFTLYVGDERNVDLNSDGISEISVKLKSINTLTKKATIVITRIGGEIPATGQSGGQGETSQGEGQGNEGTEREAIGSGILIWLIIGIVVILAGIAIVWMRKRK